MGDCPAQIGDGEVLVDALEDLQKLVHVFFAVPMHGESEIVLRGPARDFVILIEIGLRRLSGDAVHRPSDAFADAVEAQHLVAKSHRHHGEIILVFLELVARRDTAEAVDNAQCQLLVPPNLEDGLITLGRDVISSRIDYSSQPEAIQFAEKFFGALDLLLEGRFG